MLRELSRGLVVRTLHFHCQGPGFNPWLRNKDPASSTVKPKKKKTTTSNMRLKTEYQLEKFYFKTLPIVQG